MNIRVCAHMYVQYENNIVALRARRHLLEHLHARQPHLGNEKMRVLFMKKKKKINSLFFSLQLNNIALNRNFNFERVPQRDVCAFR